MRIIKIISILSFTLLSFLLSTNVHAEDDDKKNQILVITFSNVELKTSAKEDFLSNSEKDLEEKISECPKDENGKYISKHLSVDGVETELVDGKPVIGRFYGKIKIEVIGLELPLYYGEDEVTLKKGVGLDSRMPIPGEKGHVIVAGHRDTVFSRLGEIKPGDKIIVENADKEYIYTAKDSRIVPSADLGVIVPKEEECLTIYTCYPFFYIGDAPNRYILSCDFSESVEKGGKN